MSVCYLGITKFHGLSAFLYNDVAAFIYLFFYLLLLSWTQSLRLVFCWSRFSMFDALSRATKLFPLVFVSLLFILWSQNAHDCISVISVIPNFMYFADSYTTRLLHPEMLFFFVCKGAMPNFMYFSDFYTAGMPLSA